MQIKTNTVFRKMRDALLGRALLRRRAMNGEISSETKGEKLTEYIDRLETALVVAGLVVVSGLLVEDGPELWRSILTKTWPALAVIGGLLVTLGVLAEVVLAFVLARVARRIDADAALDIAKANELAADANVRAAEANRIAEAERSARVRIEQRLGGWTLDAAVQNRLVEAMKLFANTPFTLSVNPSETRFMELLNGILISAGWSRKEPPQGRPRPGHARVIALLHEKAVPNSVDGGVTLWMAHERLAEWGNAAKALAEGLMNDGDIPVEWKTCPREKLFDGLEAIHIEIGRRDK